MTVPSPSISLRANGQFVPQLTQKAPLRTLAQLSLDGTQRGDEKGNIHEHSYGCPSALRPGSG